MVKDKYICRSTIHSELITTTLKRGSVLGGGGAFLLVLGGTIMPLELLSLWGIPFFIVGMFFIGLGLLPYRKLTHLQLKPHEIHLEGHTLIFLKQGIPLFIIERSSIDKITYLEREHLYGLGIWLKRPLEKKIKIMQPRLKFARFMNDSMKRFQGCDVFLPFFTQGAYEELKAALSLSKV